MAALDAGNGERAAPAAATRHHNANAQPRARAGPQLVLALVAVTTLVGLAGCVDTSFDVCASNQTPAQQTVAVWINGTRNSQSFSGTVPRDQAKFLGHFKAGEGSYTVDAVASNLTTRYEYHGGSRTLGEGSRTLRLDVSSSGITVVQGNSGREAGRSCGDASIPEP